MDAEDRKLLIDIHGTVSSIKPVLESNNAALKALDERQRRAEIVTAEHGVKIDRLQGDLDGLGRKVRARMQQKVEPRLEGRWISFLEVLAALPQYWHVILTLGSFATAGIAIALKIWPH